MSVYTVTLDGVTDFTNFWGSTLSWGSSSWIGWFDTDENTPNETLTATINLTGSNWTIQSMKVSADNNVGADNVTVFQDLDAGDRRVHFLTLGFNSDVDLISTQIDYIDGWDGALHDVVLGSGFSRAVTLWANVNNLTTGTGHVDLIKTGGKDTIVVNSGGAGLVETGDKGDHVTVVGGSVKSVDVGSGNDDVTFDGANGDNVWLNRGLDTLTLLNGSHVFQVFSNRGNDIVTVQQDSRINHLELGEGDGTVTFSDTGRADNIKLYTGAYTVTTDQGWVESINGWQTALDLSVGTGNVGSIFLNGAFAGRHQITADGWIGSLQAWDSRSDVVTGDGGAGSLSLGDLRDTVKTGNGSVDLISTQGGNDVVRIGAGGAGTVRTGAGGDKITTTSAWVELISAGPGGDEVRLGTQGAGQVRLGDGDDIVYLQEMSDPRFGAAIAGGDGVDTLDFTAFTTGITFGLNARFYSVGAKKGDIDTPVTGFFLASSSENVNGTGSRDIISGNSDDNVLFGFGGNDKLSGRAGNDRLVGGEGNDQLKGGNDADLLEGGIGDDVHTGGNGADIFVFAAGDGADTVTDFEDGTDILRIGDHVGGFNTLGFADVGGDLLVTHDGGTILLIGYAGVTLTQDDFDFV